MPTHNKLTMYNIQKILRKSFKGLSVPLWIALVSCAAIALYLAVKMLADGEYVAYESQRLGPRARSSGSGGKQVHPAGSVSYGVALICFSMSALIGVVSITKSWLGHFDMAPEEVRQRSGQFFAWFVSPFVLFVGGAVLARFLS